MLYPYVTPLLGFNVLPNQCGTVRVVGRTDAPPTVVSVAFNDESLSRNGVTVGTPVTPEPPPPAEAPVTRTPANTKAARAENKPNLRIKRSPSSSFPCDPLTEVARERGKYKPFPTDQDAVHTRARLLAFRPILNAQEASSAIA
jgi:hypothetical protein